jgi:hypothetical protein
VLVVTCTATQSKGLADQRIKVVSPMVSHQQVLRGRCSPWLPAKPPPPILFSCRQRQAVLIPKAAPELNGALSNNGTTAPSRLRVTEEGAQMSSEATHQQSHKDNETPTSSTSSSACTTSSDEDEGLASRESSPPVVDPSEVRRSICRWNFAGTPSCMTFLDSRQSTYLP